MTPHTAFQERGLRAVTPFAFWEWAAQPFLPPKPLHPLLVHQPALTPQQAVVHAPAPANLLSHDLPEASAQLGLLDIDDLANMTLGAAALADHAANLALRCPVTLL
jgi:hypothetical protein